MLFLCLSVCLSLSVSLSFSLFKGHFPVVQHVAAINLQQLFNHIGYSKCPPLALMHALNHLVKLRLDLRSWGKSFQMTEELLMAMKMLLGLGL